MNVTAEMGHNIVRVSGNPSSNEHWPQGTALAGDALNRLDEQAAKAAPKCFSQWNIQARALCSQAAVNFESLLTRLAVDDCSHPVVLTHAEVMGKNSVICARCMYEQQS